MLRYDVVDRLIENKISVSTMESCTGGLIASLITDRSGASDIMSGAFVTYSNDAKVRQGVSEDIIKTYGVYSRETAEAMAEACTRAYSSRLGIGVTGSLGRVDPANADSQIGIVYIAVRLDEIVRSDRLVIPVDIADRHEMKLYVAEQVLILVDKMISD